MAQMFAVFGNVDECRQGCLIISLEKMKALVELVSICQLDLSLIFSIFFKMEAASDCLHVSQLGRLSKSQQQGYHLQDAVLC